MYWNNTQKAFKNQHTQLTHKITRGEDEIKRCLDLEAPVIRDYIDCEAMYEGCKTKLALLEGYIVKMSDMATWGTQEPGEDSMDTRMELTNQCEEKVQNIKTQYNLMGGNLKALEKKTKSTGDEVSVVILRGTANALKPDLLTSSITAGEVEAWMDKRRESKMN